MSGHIPWDKIKQAAKLDDEKPMHDPVNHPQHYTSHSSGVECIEITEEFNFCIGNAIKYLWRADGKNGMEDLRKAQWYVNREIERRERHANSEAVYEALNAIDDSDYDDDLNGLFEVEDGCEVVDGIVVKSGDKVLFTNQPKRKKASAKKSSAKKQRRRK